MASKSTRGQPLRGNVHPDLLGAIFSHSGTIPTQDGNPLGFLSDPATYSGAAQGLRDFIGHLQPIAQWLEDNAPKSGPFRDQVLPAASAPAFAAQQGAQAQAFNQSVAGMSQQQAQRADAARQVTQALAALPMAATAARAGLTGGIAFGRMGSAASDRMGDLTASTQPGGTPNPVLGWPISLLMQQVEQAQQPRRPQTVLPPNQLMYGR